MVYHKNRTKISIEIPFDSVFGSTAVLSWK